MLAPRLVLLDEPSFGLAPLVVRELFGILRTINADAGFSILVVEQNAAMALEHAHQGCVNETGRGVLAGSADQLKGDDAVRRSYLGY
jgi:branched-chain amino acid transport system ATP-binding protein